MNIRLLGFLAVLTVIRLVYIGRVELSPDEAQYYEWSQRLDWCYFSKGPGVALAIKLGTMLFGPSEFGIRFLAPILALGTSLILYVLARRIYEPRVATWTVVLANVTPLFNAGGLIMTIDPLSIFFWSAALYTLWRAFEDYQDAANENPLRGIGWWAASGALIGFGFWCKWTNAMQLLSVLLLVVLTKRFRGVFRSVGFWAMLGVFLLFVIPVALWNETHGWPTTHHLAARGGLDTPWWQIDVKSFGQFVATHFGVYSPFIFAAMLVALWQASRDSVSRWLQGLVTCWVRIPKGARKYPLTIVVFALAAGLAWLAGNYFDSRQLHQLSRLIIVVGLLIALSRHKEAGNIHWRSRFLAAFALPLVLMYAWIALHHDAEVNWTAPASVSVFVLVGQLADRLWNADSRRLVVAGVSVGAVMSIVAMNPDIVRALGVPWRMDRDHTARLRGWSGTAMAVQKFRDEFEKQTGKKVFLIGENYGVAAELCYYLPEKRIEGPGHPAVYVEESPVPTSQFHFWGRYDEFEERTAPVVNDQEDTAEVGTSRFAGRTALYITTRDEKKPPSVLKRTFDRWEVGRDFRIEEDGQLVRTVRIFICHRYKPGMMLD